MEFRVPGSLEVFVGGRPLEWGGRKQRALLAMLLLEANRAHADQSALGPHVLTSVLKRADVSVYEAIQAATEGRFRGGRTVELGLREHAVGLGAISPRIPRPLVAQVERIRRQIVSGTISGIPTVLR